MVFFVINFIGNKRYQLWKRKMGYFAPFILDLYISGAFVTRYISYEGMMPIREGAVKIFYSDKTFLTVFCRWGL
jgi:hypothetical protein